MKQPETPLVAKRFHKLTSFYYLMVGLPLLAFAWVYLNMERGEPWIFFEESSFRPLIHFLLIFMALSFAFWSFIRYRKQLKQREKLAAVQKGERSLEEKVQDFYEASLQKYLWLAVATFAVVLAFYGSLEAFYVPLYALLLILFSAHRPTAEKMAKDMRLKKEEQAAIKEILRANP